MILKHQELHKDLQKERSIVGKQILKLNAEDVFLKHTNDATYFIHSEELLNGLGR